MEISFDSDRTQSYKHSKKRHQYKSDHNNGDEKSNFYIVSCKKSKIKSISFS